MLKVRLYSSIPSSDVTLWVGAPRVKLEAVAVIMELVDVEGAVVLVSP